MSVRPLGSVRSDREFAVGCAESESESESKSGSGSGSSSGDARRDSRESSDDRRWIEIRRRRRGHLARAIVRATGAFRGDATRGIMRVRHDDVARCRTTRRRYYYDDDDDDDDGATTTRTATRTTTRTRTATTTTTSGPASARSLLPPQQRNYVRVRFRDHVVSGV